MDTTAAAKPSVVAPEVLDDLRSRLRSFRSTARQDVDDWSLGVEPRYFDRLLRVWRGDHDWRRVESRVRALPWVLAGAADAAVRIVHQRAADPTAVPVVLLHGWPDSVLRFEKVLPKLRDVHVLVPALPGFPFAASTARSIRSAADMATAIAAAIVELGYDSYVVSAGDVGTDIAESLAARYPDRVAALHLTDLSHHYALNRPPADLAPEEESYLAAVHRWHADEGAYNQLQSTRPNTLAIALGDSPAGLAAWIVEKLHAWSDHNGDLDTVFSPHEVLDWVTTYWVTGAMGTSFAPYAHRSAPGPIMAPTTFTMFPRDLVNAPRSFAARFLDVVSYTVASRGGHFDAWEHPDAYVEGLKAAIARRRVPT